MSLMLRRHARSTGYAHTWLYGLFCVGFAGLAAWAGVEGQWWITAFATVMSVVCIAAVPVTRRLAQALAASHEQLSD